MTQDTEYGYEFQPGLPIEGVAKGTNLLLGGPSASGARAVALDLLTAATRHEGILLISADVGGEALLQRLDESPQPITRSMLGIVDCSGSAPHQDRRFLAHATPIEDPGDLTSIEIEFSILYEKLSERDPRGIRIGMFSLSSLLAHTSLKNVSRFLHMLTGRIIATGDLGVFVCDSAAQDERTVETLRHYCDGYVEVRDAGDVMELRVDGLPDQPEEWAPVEYEVAELDGWREATSEHQ